MEKSDTPQDQDSTAKDANKGKNKGADSKSVAASSKSPPPPNKRDDPDNPANPSKIKAWLKQYSTLVVELLVLLVGIYVALIYSKQLDQMIESNKISHASLETVQRAFLNFRAIQYQLITDVSGPKRTNHWKISAQWENTGTTPAIHVFQHIGAKILPSEPDGQTFIGRPEDPSYPAYIGPKAVQATSEVIQPYEFFTPEQIPKDTEKRFLLGWIAYYDVFPNTPMHLTEFCTMVLRPEIQIGKSGQINVDFLNCKKHNCADQDCSDYSEILAFVAKR